MDVWVFPGHQYSILINLKYSAGNFWGLFGLHWGNGGHTIVNIHVRGAWDVSLIFRFP